MRHVDFPNTASAAEQLRSALRDRGEVLMPSEAEEPILAPSVRAAILGWLAEIRAKEELRAVGIKPRSTGLLFGPPGCGKTTLAHHLAARLGVPLVNVGAENLISKGWGDSEQNVAALFSTLTRKDIPCVVFLDEVEAIGGNRAQNKGMGADNARTSMLTVLLRRIETFEGLLIAATNREKDLDPALWRRFGMQIDVALPDDDARYAILKRYAHPFDLGDNVFEALTEITAGAAPSLLRQAMEGMKRIIILGERMRRMPPDLVVALKAIVAETKPHPDYDPPAMWANPALLDVLGDAPWPPVRSTS